MMVGSLLTGSIVLANFTSSNTVVIAILIRVLPYTVVLGKIERFGMDAR